VSSPVRDYRYAEIVFQKLSGVPATHSLAYVDEGSVTTADLDDAASELGSHNIEVVPVMARFFSSVMTRTKDKGARSLYQVKMLLFFEQQEGLPNGE
jgi:hypothetical protein